jgi:hypothetical protein
MGLNDVEQHPSLLKLSGCTMVVMVLSDLASGG